MIGINSSPSPMSMFPSLGRSGGPSMYEMGYNSSPGGAVSNVLNQTIDKYWANIDAQQQQQDKLGQIDATSRASLANDKAMVDYKRQPIGEDPDSKGVTVQLEPTTGKYFYKSTTINADGTPKVSWAPVSPNAPENVEQTMKNTMLGPVVAAMKAKLSGNPYNGEQPPQNVIQQGAAVAPAVPSVNANANLEGKTATNPKTGQKIIYKGGKWQPI